MQLNLKTDYSLRLLLYLTLHPGRLSTVLEVASAFRISAHHLSKVAQTLGELGFIELVRGRGGGIRLSVEPSQIRLAAVVRKMEGSLALLECFDSQTNTCVISPVCALKGMMQEAQSAFLAVLEQYTIADVAANSGVLQSLLSRGGKSEPRNAGSVSGNE